MKPLPLITLVSSMALLVSCSPKPTASDKLNEERVAEERQAQDERAMREREAALDERERRLDEMEKRLLAMLPPGSQPGGQPGQPGQPGTTGGATTAPGASPTPAYATDTTYQMFYDNLEPYGTWFQLAGYGYVWQPKTAADPAWKPYTQGRWAFTDQGWAWVSDEPFGWVTYHYGRWLRTKSTSWVWVPGDQWAPAWVSWRYGGEYAGWAPLPPEARLTTSDGIKQWADDAYNLTSADYTFVPASNFGDPSMAAASVPADQAEPIYDQSNNITNIYYDSGAYAVYCYGPSFEYLRSKARHALLPYLTIRRAAFRADGKNGAAIASGIFQITAPHIYQSRTPVAPKSIRSRVEDSRAPGQGGAAAQDVMLTPHLEEPGNPAQLQSIEAARKAAEQSAAAAAAQGQANQQLNTQRAQELQAIDTQKAERQVVEDAQANAALQAAREAAQRASDLRAAKAADARAAAESQAAWDTIGRGAPVAPVHSAPVSIAPVSVAPVQTQQGGPTQQGGATQQGGPSQQGGPTQQGQR